MGKHWGNSSSEQAVRARITAVRCISGGFCLSLAVLTFGVQGLSGTGSAVTPSSSLASGVVGPGVLDPGTAGAAASAASGNGGEAPASSAVTADALALVAYTRSQVETASKSGVPGELNVASSGLKRPAEGFLMAPLESLRESSPFGLRTSPITGSAGEFHWGQDYAAACGTRVYAADAGVVRAVGWHPWGGGNRVEIDHGNGLITTYNHLEAIAVKKGDSVRVGEVIARVGTTGSSTGCHLHFETILNGSHKNPHDWTLLPIKQTDHLGTIAMTSYAPDADKPSNAALGWAVPVSDDKTHEVTGGAQELPVSALPKLPLLPPATPTPEEPSPTKPRPDTPRSNTPPAGHRRDHPPRRGAPSRRAAPRLPRSPAPPPPRRSRHRTRRRRIRRRRRRRRSPSRRLAARLDDPPPPTVAEPRRLRHVVEPRADPWSPPLDPAPRSAAARSTSPPPPRRPRRHTDREARAAAVDAHR